MVRLLKWALKGFARKDFTENLENVILQSSQNHRMFGVGRDLRGSSSPTSLPKQGHLQQAAEDLVQVGLQYLQRRRLHSLPGQPVPGLHHPQREEVLPHGKFVGKVHSIDNQMNEIQNQRFFWVENDLYGVEEKCKEVGTPSYSVNRFWLDPLAF